MKRRTFLHSTAVSVGLAGMHAFPHHLFAAPAKKQATDKVKLGPAGVEVSRLAMGTGTSGSGGSSNQLRGMGSKGLADHLRRAYDNGITFWETADQYGTHPQVKMGMRGLKREQLTILTKTHATTAAEMKADLDRFRRELGTDYIDIMLLHGMRIGDWPEQKKAAMEVLSEAKEKGIIRTHGVSCHSLDAMKTAARTPWVEVDLARINLAGVITDAKPQTVLEVLGEMKKAGKGVIGMKVFGAGRLRDRTDECLQFVLAQAAVDCFTIGTENKTEFEQLLKKIPDASVRG